MQPASHMQKQVPDPPEARDLLPSGRETVTRTGTSLQIVQAWQFLEKALQLGITHTQPKEKEFEISERIPLKGKVPAVEVAGNVESGRGQIAVNKIISQCSSCLPLRSDAKLDVVQIQSGLLL